MARYIAHEDTEIRVVADDQRSTNIFVEIDDGFDAIGTRRWRHVSTDEQDDAVMKRLVAIVVVLSGRIKVLETQLADAQRPSGIE